MSNLPTYTSFFEQVQNSISEGTFAKLTLAKTIGKPELQNIYVRTAVDGENLKLSVTFKTYNEIDGLLETEKIIEIQEMESELIPYINNPFMSVLLFTTEADLTMKLNKKRVATITEQPPTFKNPDANLVAFYKK